MASSSPLHLSVLPLQEPVLKTKTFRRNLKEEWNWGDTIKDLKKLELR